MQVGRYAEVGCAALLLGPAVETVACQGWITIGAGYVAEDFVIGSVLADDEETVFEAWQWGVIGDVGGVRSDDGLGKRIGVGQASQRNHAQAAHFKLAYVVGAARIMLLAAIRAGALALGVNYVENLAVGRECQG